MRKFKMGKKAKAHRAKVAKRNREFEAHIEKGIEEQLEILLNIRRQVWEKVTENGFSTVEEAWEKSPEIFLDVFPGEDLETIHNGLQLDWIREKIN